MDSIKFTILAILSVQFTLNYVHITVQLTSPSISRIFSILQAWNYEHINQ